MQRFLAVAAVFLTVNIAAAQTLEFDVASVKPGAPGSERIGVGIRGEEVRVSNLPLRTITQWAYNISPQLRHDILEGGPDWMDRDGFDIVAKAPKRPTVDEARAMLQKLLADRFKLRVHKESRDVPVYALVLAKKDGALGPGLRRSTHDCAAFSAAIANGDFNTDLRTADCNLRNRAGGAGAMAIRGSAAIPVMIPLISRGREIDRPIVDRTGLTGTFDIELSWTPLRPGARGAGLTPATSDGTIIFTALQEQLGLKLESQRGTVEAVVVDSVQRPASD
jgi:uncharacterized protein (TIGR03435 family)